MILTYISRATDGLLLCGSLNVDDLGTKINDYQNQAKQLIKTIRPDSPPQMTIETGPYVFHYLIENSICFLCLCEKSFSNRLAMLYLENIATEFLQLYGSEIYSVKRPYLFIAFDSNIQEARKKLNATKSRRNINMLGTELQGVQRIMVENINDVLQRGAAIQDLDSKASNLSLMSQNYRKGASMLNRRATLTKVVAGGVLMIILILYLWVL